MKVKKTKAEHKAKIWVDPEISKKMKGSGGNRAFDPAAEAYRRAYLGSTTKRPDSEGLLIVPHYGVESAYQKNTASAELTFPTDRPGKTKFPVG